MDVTRQNFDKAIRLLSEVLEECRVNGEVMEGDELYFEIEEFLDEEN